MSTVEDKIDEAARLVPERIAQLEAERAALTDKINRLKKVESAWLEPQQNGRRRRPTNKPRPPVNTVRRTAQALLTHAGPNVEFTSAEVFAWLGIDKKNTTYYEAIRQLREDRAIAATTRRKLPSGQQTNVYEILDADLLRKAADVTE